MKGHICKRGERSWAIVVDVGRDLVTGNRDAEGKAARDSARA